MVEHNGLHKLLLVECGFGILFGCFVMIILKGDRCHKWSISHLKSLFDQKNASFYIHPWKRGTFCLSLNSFGNHLEIIYQVSSLCQLSWYSILWKCWHKLSEILMRILFDSCFQRLILNCRLISSANLILKSRKNTAEINVWWHVNPLFHTLLS